MTRDEALAALGHLEHLVRRSPDVPEALAEFRSHVAALKAVPGAGAAFCDNLAHAELNASQLFIPQERGNTGYTSRTYGVSLTILLLADIAAARRNLPKSLS